MCDDDEEGEDEKEGYNCGNELNLLDDLLDREATLVDAVREIKHGAVIIARVPVL